MLDLLNVFEQLRAVPSPSGREENATEAVIEMVKPYVDEIYSDAMGNLVAHKRGSGKKIMFSAHIDEIGIVITHIEKEGWLRFAAVGGIAPFSLLNAPVVTLGGVKGVVSKDGKADVKSMTLQDMYIDIGVDSEEEARKLVRVGERALYDFSIRKLANGRVASPYMDDKIGCTILIGAMEMVGETDNDLYFTFSTQEEVGIRGAGPAAFAIAPDYAVAVDVTRTGDTPDPKPKMECRLGGGAAIKLMDSSVICSPTIVAMLEDCAKKREINYQFEVLEAGGTDARAMQQTGEGAVTGAVSIPTRYIHSPSEMVDMADVEACVRLIAAFAESKL